MAAIPVMPYDFEFRHDHWHVCVLVVIDVEVLALAAGVKNCHCARHTEVLRGKGMVWELIVENDQGADLVNWLCYKK